MRTGGLAVEVVDIAAIDADWRYGLEGTNPAFKTSSLLAKSPGANESLFLSQKMDLQIGSLCCSRRPSKVGANQEKGNAKLSDADTQLK